jgi:hypothetical protein
LDIWKKLRILNNNQKPKYMSKNSTKSQYEQLMAWIPTLKSKRTAELVAREQPVGKFSKADHYKSKGAYGKAGN